MTAATGRPGPDRPGAGQPGAGRPDAGYLGFLADALRDAGALARHGGDRIPATTKAGDRNQVVTEVDRAVGARLVQRVRAAFPDDAVLDEEAGALAGAPGHRRTWIIDPIDGTSNFAAGSPLYGSMMAVLVGGAPVAAGILLPALGELYLAERGRGAYCNGRRLAAATPGPLADCLVGYGVDVGPEAAADWRLLARLAPHVRGVRMSNSIFDAAMVARGAYAGYVHRRLQIWDIAPIQVLVTEAGGRCTDLRGRELDYRDPLARAGQEYDACVSAAGAGDALRARLGIPPGRAADNGAGAEAGADTGSGTAARDGTDADVARAGHVAADGDGARR
ncbi:MAG TPA: inositol monophosphatase [Pilimelia sp.]|nr:inositol monophosphatase [Pilimelia sp.]